MKNLGIVSQTSIIPSVSRSRVVVVKERSSAAAASSRGPKDKGCWRTAADSSYVMAATTTFAATARSLPMAQPTTDPLEIIQ